MSVYFSINITLPSFNKIELIIYYLFLLGFIISFRKLNKKKKVMYICTLMIFLFCFYNKVNLNINGKVYFLDVYEGDATVIDLPLNKGVVMIDTGAKSSDVLTFLKSIGVRKIDYLILTHSHEDHTGNAKELINNFKVDKLITSIYNYGEYGLTKTYVKAGDIIKINSYSFEVLSPSFDNNDENDNSIVLLSKLGNDNYLFLGDVSKKIEDKLASLDLNVDMVKVAHHGSKTSTSEKLYYKINPKNVFIETGRKERFNFPNEEVITRLSRYNIYRTDQDYTIVVSFNKFNARIKKTRKDF